MLRIDVNSSRELQATILAIRESRTDIQKNIRQQTKKVVQPEFQKAMAERANTRLEHRVLVATARVKVSNQNVTLSTASVGRKLQGGLLPREQKHVVEFGADREKKTTYYARSSKGKDYKVTRKTRMQFRPRKRTGYVFYPAVAEIVPRIAALWVQTTVYTFNTALEKG